MRTEPGGVAAPAWLSEAEAAERSVRFGPNALVGKRRHLLRSLAAKLTGPVPFLLEAPSCSSWRPGR